MTPLELRLRQRIDVLTDERDEAREQLEKARKRADKYRCRCYDLERGRVKRYRRKVVA